MTPNRQVKFQERTVVLALKLFWEGVDSATNTFQKQF